MSLNPNLMKVIKLCFFRFFLLIFFNSSGFFLCFGAFCQCILVIRKSEVFFVFKIFFRPYGVTFT